MLRPWSLGATIAILGCGAGAEASHDGAGPLVPLAQPTASGTAVALPGDGRELVWISRPEPKALIGRTPFWSVSVQPLAKDSEASSELALGRFDSDAKSLSLTRLLPSANRVLRWPGHPHSVVLEGGRGVELLEGEKSRSVPEAGVWCFSGDGQWAAVAGTGPAHLSFYETKGWTKRAQLPVQMATGAGTFSGTRYFEVDQDHALVIDIEASKVLLDRGGYAALSPKQKTLGVLGQSDFDWGVDLYDWARLDKPRHTKFPDVLFNGLPFVEFVGERTLFIRERLGTAHMDYDQLDRASVDVPSGRLSPIKEAATTDGEPTFHAEQDAEQVAAVAAAGRFVVKPRMIIPSSTHSRSYAWLHEQGRIAAAVGEPRGDCSSSMLMCTVASPGILFVDTKARKKIAEVALPVKEGI